MTDSGSVAAAIHGADASQADRSVNKARPADRSPIRPPDCRLGTSLSCAAAGGDQRQQATHDASESHRPLTIGGW